MLSFMFLKQVLLHIIFAGFVFFLLITFVNFVEIRGRDSRSVVKYDDECPPMKDLKMILLWNKFFTSYNYMFRMDGTEFSGRDGCLVDNCIVTSDRNLRPLEEYDAVVFHIWWARNDDFPKTRRPEQYYAFVSLESALMNAVDTSFDDFFNWTLSYRFDSDFIWPYFWTLDKKGKVIAPAVNPLWKYSANKRVVEIVKSKSKKVAWFVSHCQTPSLREQYVEKLQRYIKVDIYGKCGPLNCPQNDKKQCFKMLKRNYYFYLAFENSHCQDYITEKPYNALQYDTIPIVYGQANYSQFLPPHSYLDANKYTPEGLAELINFLIENPAQYAKYFWWKNKYSFHDNYKKHYLHPFCAMCKALNDPNLEPKRYKSFKKWWDGSASQPVCVRPTVTDKTVAITNNVL